MLAAGTPILEIGDPTDLEIEAEMLSRDAVGCHGVFPNKFHRLHNLKLL